MKLAILDYEMGNLNSVEKAFVLATKNLGLQNKISINNTRDKNFIENADCLILPGVGAFGAAVENLKKLGLFNTIKTFAENKPILGICLGYQLLFEKSFEDGEHNGLALIKGSVKKFNADKKVPHIGWNQVDFGSNFLFEGIAQNSYFYFVHSYYVSVDKNFDGDIFWTDYGTKFASGIQKQNIFGLQFHPEKSQKNGIKLLENFIKYLHSTSKI